MVLSMVKKTKPIKKHLETLTDQINVMLHTNHLKSETRYFQVHDLEAKGSKILSRISCSTFITCFIEMIHVAKEQRKKEKGIQASNESIPTCMWKQTGNQQHHTLHGFPTQ